MKKCPKCGLSYGDDMNFCTVCGEKLSSSNACPKCGKELPDDAKFCPGCGYSLEAKPAPSPAQVEAVPAAAPVVEEAPKEEAPKAESKAPKILNIIFSAVLLLSVLFTFIGMWGDMFTISSNGKTDHYGLDYFFGKGADQLNQIGQALPGTGYYSMNVFFFVVENILFFSALVGSLILMVFAIISNVKGIANKSKPAFKLTALSGAVYLPIIMLFSLRYMVNGNIDGTIAASGTGWGASMIITGLMITLVSVAGYKIANAAIAKQGLAAAIVRSVTAILLAIIFLVAFSPIGVIKYNYSGYEFKVEANGYYLTQVGELILAANPSLPSETTAKLGTMCTFGFLSLLACVPGLILVYSAIMKSFKGSKAGPIVSLSIAFTLIIVSAIFAVSAGNIYIEVSGFPSSVVINAGFSSGAIGGIVLSFFALGGLITASVLEGK